MSQVKQMYKCPECERRIFDAAEGDKATITIKCPKCKRVVDVPVLTSIETKSQRNAG